MNPAIDVLGQYKDYLLFKETPDQIVSAGVFDNNWSLPAEESAKIKSSSVVTIK